MKHWDSVLFLKTFGKARTHTHTTIQLFFLLDKIKKLLKNVSFFLCFLCTLSLDSVALNEESRMCLARALKNINSIRRLR